MGKGKAIGLLVLIIIVAAAAYLYLPGIDLPAQPSGNFSQEYSALSNSWKNAGLSEEKMHANFDALLSMPRENLSQVKQSLNQSKSSAQGQAMQEITDIYIILTDIAIKTKQLAALNDSINLNADICENVLMFEEVNQGTTELTELYDSYALKIIDFVQKHPTEAEAIGFYRLGTGFEAEKQQLQDLKEGLEIVKAGC